MPATRRTTTGRRPRTSRGGFTITELMISVALTLVLTAAVGLIFRTTTETIEKGTATNDVVRNLDAARTALQLDFTGGDDIDFDAFTDRAGILPNREQPMIVISSLAGATFRDQSDFESDARANYDPASPDTDAWINDALTLDQDGDLTEEPGEVLDIFTGQARRVFRMDQLSFGAAGGFPSETAASGSGTFTQSVQGQQALVYYGHLRVFNNDYGSVDVSAGYGAPGRPVTPGGQPNVNNRFANQFILGRMTLPLIDPNRDDATGTDAIDQEYIVDASGREVPFYRRTWNTPQEDSRDIQPLQAYVNTAVAKIYNGDSTLVNYGENGQGFPMYRGRVDVLGTSASELRERMAFVVETDPTVSGATNRSWPYEQTDDYSRQPRPGGGNVGLAWWERWFWSENFRVWINPYGQQPFDASSMGQRTHFLTPGAQQFIVEYAGDYFEQAPDGTITDVDGDGLFIEPDGTIDFFVDAGGRRGIRFYGFPRDADGDGDIRLEAINASAGSVRYLSPDVVPLKDMVGNSSGSGAVPTPTLAASETNTFPFPHEKRVPTVERPDAATEDYVADGPAPSIYGGYYVCAWTAPELDGNFPAPFDFPLGPKLIRVIVEAADPDGNLENAVSTELVFRVPEE